MKRVIWSAAALCLLVCLLAMPTQIRARSRLAKNLLALGDVAKTDQAEFQLTSIQKKERTSLCLKYRIHAEQQRKCKLELIGDGAQARKSVYVELPETGEVQGDVHWNVDQVQRVIVTLPSASGNTQFTYAIDG